MPRRSSSVWGEGILGRGMWYSFLKDSGHVCLNSLLQDGSDGGGKFNFYIQFLHTILARDPDELIYNVYQAQKRDPIQGDFCELVENDFKLLNLQLSEESLQSRSSFNLK